MKITESQFSITYLLIRLMNALRLNSAVKFLLKFAPEKLQTWLSGIKIRTIYKDRHIPAEELKPKYRQALQLLAKEQGAEVLGDYLEFGVSQGTSMSCMYQVLEDLGFDHIRLFGFDSFEGLPDTIKTDDDGIWQPGDYKSEYEDTKQFLTEQGVNWERVILVKGWFSETLKPELIHQHKITKASVIMVDCDLYSSTKDALNFCLPLIQEQAIIFFDDWNTQDLADKNMGEKKAFDEFLNVNPQFTAEELSSYSYIATAKVFRVVRNSTI